MQEAIEGFLVHLSVERGLSENTMAAYRQALSSLRSFLWAFDPPVSSCAEVSREHIRGFLVSLWTQKYAPASARLKIAAIRTFFRFLVAEEIIENDPTQWIDSPRVGRHLPNILAADEVAAFLDGLCTNTPVALRDKALFEMLYGTGMRITELISLNLSHVSFTEQSVRFMAKGSKERVLPVGELALESIERYLESGRPKLVRSSTEKALFLNHDGGRISRITVYVRLRYLIAQLSIRGQAPRTFRSLFKTENLVSPHTLRHCYATHMLDNGADLMTISNLLGHVNIATTLIYTHVSVDTLRKAYDNAHPRAEFGDEGQARP